MANILDHEIKHFQPTQLIILKLTSPSLLIFAVHLIVLALKKTIIIHVCIDT